MRFKLIALGVYCFWLGLTLLMPDQPSFSIKISIWSILWLIGFATDEILKTVAARASEKGDA